VIRIGVSHFRQLLYNEEERDYPRPHYTKKRKGPAALGRMAPRGVGLGRWRERERGGGGAEDEGEDDGAR
jgi:hypothetical protein